jgi:hypothetical protein
MKSKHAILFLFTLAALPLFGQKNFVPGWVITRTGDSLQGFIDLRSTNRMSSFVAFKANPESDSTIRFTPREVNFFLVDEERYVSKRTDTTQFNRYVFMQQIVEGRMNLYTYGDLYDVSYFYVEKGEDFEQLTNETKEIVKTDPATGSPVRYEVDSRKYLQTLTYLFSDCEKMAGQSLSFPFNLKGISMAVDQYNACFSDSSTIISKKPDKKLAFYLTGLVGLNWTRTEEESRNSFYNFADGKTRLSLGVMGQLYPASFNQKIGMEVGLLYQGISSSSRNQQANLDLDYLDIIAGFSFKYPGKRIEPLVSGGFKYGFLLNGNSDSFTTVFGEAEANYHSGFYINAGLNVKLQNQHGITVRYVFERTTMSFNLVSVGFRNYLHGMRVGYYF